MFFTISVKIASLASLPSIFYVFSNINKQSLWLYLLHACLISTWRLFSSCPVVRFPCQYGNSWWLLEWKQYSSLISLKTRFISLRRLVLMSATAEIGRYRDYFRGLGRGERVEVIAIPSSPQHAIYQRNVSYLEQVNSYVNSSYLISLLYISFCHDNWTNVFCDLMKMSLYTLHKKKKKKGMR